MFQSNQVTALAYRRVCDQARRKRVWSSLTRRSRNLLSLAEIESTGKVSKRCNTEIKTVSIDQIRGSGGRTSDFDRDFNPLKTHTKDRWLGIAQARQEGQVLPPVSLTQVGDTYFVRDGHHRISVARAWGQKEIEARVTVWQVKGLLS